MKHCHCQCHPYLSYSFVSRLENFLVRVLWGSSSPDSKDPISEGYHCTWVHRDSLELDSLLNYQGLQIYLLVKCLGLGRLNPRNVCYACKEILGMKYVNWVHLGKKSCLCFTSWYLGDFIQLSWKYAQCIEVIDSNMNYNKQIDNIFVWI